MSREKAKHNQEPTLCRFLAACNRRRVDRPPVWMMRQAGRYLPAYRAVRKKVDFATLCRTPDLAAQVTLQPVDVLGVDAAIIFSDILVLTNAMGLQVDFQSHGGPRLRNPIQSISDIRKLHPPDIEKDLSFVGKAIRLTAEALRTRNIPVIGFAGAPFTLACYAIEGETSREFNKTRRFFNQHPRARDELLEKLTLAIELHLAFQIQSGANAVQIFDTWGGLLNQQAYRQWILPHLKNLIQSLKKLQVPVILYLQGSTPHLRSMVASGADVLSVDWRLPLDQVRKIVGPRVALQGNLDPTTLYASKPEILNATQAMLRLHPSPGYIANLGHGILPDIPVEHVRTFVSGVKNS